MAFQGIDCVDIQLSGEVRDTNNAFLPETSATLLNADHSNGASENPSESNLLLTKKLQNDVTLLVNKNDLLFVNCDADMPTEIIDISDSNPEEGTNCNEIVEDNLTNCHNGRIIEESESSSNDSLLGRANSSDTSCEDCSNSEDPSLDNISNCQNDEQRDISQDDLSEKDHNCLLHPTYLLTVRKVEEKEQNIICLGNQVSKLQDLLSAEGEKSTIIQELEQRLIQYEREFNLSKKEHELERRTFDTIKKEIEAKCVLLKKDFETANREKENMVMRYAVSEKELIDIKKERETLMKKLKEATKENELQADRVKTLVAEKSKVSQLLDSKSIDLTTSHKEIDKLKEEIHSRDIKIKWTQNKLKTEMEAHKECPQQVDKLMSKIKNLEEELSVIKLENQNIKKEIQETEQNQILVSQLKEEQAKLIMERHEHSEVESKYKTLQTKHHLIIEENNTLSIQVQRLEIERLEMEKKLSISREETERLSNIVTDLQSKLVVMESLTSQLKQSEEKLGTLMNEIDRVRHQNEELLQDMSACRAREAEMLSFTQKLTTKNVQLQSEFTAMETKVSDLEKSEDKSHSKVRELKQQVTELQNQLNKEKAKREEETKLLARQVAEKTKKGELAETELLDTKATLTHTKQRHGTVVKELQRELLLVRRKLENHEVFGSFKQSESMNSLSESNFNQNCDLSPQNLVERILKLQKDNAKYAEKIEFLEEHSTHLLSEVQRKSRLLQSYMLREEAGALAPSFVDNHKAEVTKHGGIMASLYGGTPQDDGISLELSLEINRKLQAILEDTLLKNIMLKENIDTLGDEISRLSSNK